MNIKFEIKNLGDKFLDKFLNTLCISTFILSILGIIERVVSYNIFTLLETSNVVGVQSSTYIRLGELRVTTSFSHTLGYGLYLLLIIPIAYYQMKKHKNLNKRRHTFYLVLLILLLINMLFTSSRSVLIAFAVEFLMFFIMSNLKTKLIIFHVGFLLALPLLVFSITSYAEKIPVISSIGANVKSLSDTFLGTSLATNFGSNAEPFTYRQELIKYAFSLQGLENMFGKGIGFIRTKPLQFYLPQINPYDLITSITVDNYYINVKLEQGWVGLLATAFLFLAILLNLYRKRKENKLNIFILTAFMGYFVQLTMVNDLGTLKYFWILFALFSGYEYQFKDKELN